MAIIQLIEENFSLKTLLKINNKKEIFIYFSYNAFKDGHNFIQLITETNQVF